MLRLSADIDDVDRSGGGRSSARGS
ncbi:hypothetical protein CURTO8I2_180046 [Curtobacterium sp. 8I-2]|nr:hypothetical protein CURTO8I2_180046 [Curtobacterium sp. 8I-2]